MTTKTNGSEQTLDGALATAVTIARSDIRGMAQQLSRSEVRDLVDLYYQMQEYRKAAANQVRSLEQADETPILLPTIYGTVEALEKSIAAGMDVWTRHGDDATQWARAVYGIGPVIAAGLAAHIDFARATTAGAVWRYAGLDPTAKWKKGEKRPFNARLKVLAWKAGDSFVKFHNRDDCFYGKLYEQRKRYEIERNEAGDLADQAAATLSERNITDKATRARYEEGRLPDGRLDLRARRWAVKLFLAHYWQKGREASGLPVPVPYPIDHLGHAHTIDPPEAE